MSEICVEGVPKVLGHGLSKHAALFELNTTVSKTKYQKLIIIFYIIICILVFKPHLTSIIMYNTFHL